MIAGVVNGEGSTQTEFVEELALTGEGSACAVGTPGTMAGTTGVLERPKALLLNVEMELVATAGTLDVVGMLRIVA